MAWIGERWANSHMTRGRRIGRNGKTAAAPQRRYRRRADRVRGRRPTLMPDPRTDTPAGAAPATAMSPEEFRTFGHQVVDWIADYRSRLADLPVLTRAQPGELLARLPASPPVEPEGFGAVLRDLDELILPALSHWQHPRFFGYFPSNGDLSSVLGDFLSTGLGALGLAWQAAPALTELEERAVDWLRQLLGLSPSFSGVIQDTASTCTLVALLCARERSTQHGQNGPGLQGGGPPLVVYQSQHAHSSVEKAALLAGFGRAFVRKIPVD